MTKPTPVDLILLAGALAPMIVFLAAIGFASGSGSTRRDMATTCAKAGYPDLIYPGGRPYCRRLLNGTDELVPVEQVHREDRRRRAVESYRRAWGEPDQPSTPEPEHPTLSDKEPQ